MKQICILYIPCEGEIKLMAIPDTEEEKNKLVSGIYKFVTILADNPILMVTNELARKKNAALNIRATCLANSFCKMSNNSLRDLAIFGDVFIEGSEFNPESEQYQSCSIPPDLLEDLIDFCNRADVWWVSLGKKIVDSKYVKWFVKPVEYDDEF